VLFTSDAVELAVFIRRARGLCLSLTQIRDILAARRRR
jgi:DNA-binding transcriptional MerR regulator